MDQDMKLLLFDEDESARQRLAIRLAPLGFAVYQTGILADAQAFVVDQSPDLIVLEWGNDHRSGEEVFRDLKAAPAKCYVFTAQPLESIESELNRCGVKQAFRKSDRLELLDFLEKFRKGKTSSMPPTFPGSACGKGWEVLVVDDSSTVRLSIRLALRERFPNCEVREADDGHAAFAEMGRKRVNLLITDLEMPGMDGRDFLARLDANPILRKKPVIVFSGHINSELHEAYAERSNICFLQKSCSPSRVVETAAQMLGEAKVV